MRNIFAMLLLITISQTVYSQTFTIDSKGIVKCPNARVGERSTINGKTYVAVDRNYIIQVRWIPLIDYTTFCTSLVTDMSNLFSGYA